MMAATGVPNKYLARFWDFVDIGAGSECWHWHGPTKPDGYGIFTARDPFKRTVYVHRHVHELLVGDIPDEPWFADREAWAFLSDCGTYRYSLTRHVAPSTGDETVTFVMLNPSTADAERDDPTIRRCIGFARSWGFEWLKVVNLYAYRATDPRDLYAYTGDRVGPENDCTIAKVVGGSDLIVCAWGANNTNGRDEKVLDLIAAPHSLGLTKHGGKPRHPLYVRADTRPLPFAHCPWVAAWELSKPENSQASADE